jgi:hypothetical protein
MIPRPALHAVVVAVLGTRREDGLAPAVSQRQLRRCQETDARRAVFVVRHGESGHDHGRVIEGQHGFGRFQADVALGLGVVVRHFAFMFGCEGKSFREGGAESLQRG